jgi:CelD/BcsL family acetyltransferase involved in cellulose biosynthesis
VCGFFPFEILHPWIGGPIGTVLNDAQGIIACDGAGWDPRGVVRSTKLRLWKFDHLLTSQHAFAPFHRSVHRSPIIDLSGGLDDYLEWSATHSKGLRSQIAARRRKLEREIGTLSLEWHSSRPEDLALVMSWKSAQYRRTGKADLLAEPRTRGAVEDLAQTATDDCTGVLNVLRAGDVVLAAHLGLSGRHGLSWWFPAYDPEYGRYSPGLVLLMAVVTSAADRGLRFIDLGRGENAYKLRFANGSYTVADGSVLAGGRLFRGALHSRARLKALVG